MAEPEAVDVPLVADSLIELAIRFSKTVLIGVRGELDMLTAPGLGALMGALVDAGELSNAMAIEAFTAVLLQLNIRYKTRVAPRLTGIKD